MMKKLIGLWEKSKESVMTNREAVLRIGEHCRIHLKAEPESIMITEALNIAIKALEQQEKEKWIPVSERLPNEKQEVIATGNKKVACLLYLDGKFWSGMLDQTHLVVAWKPMPEPYLTDEI